MARTITWHSHIFSGQERCILEQTAAGYVLRGDAQLTLAEQPAQLIYTVVCDAGWRTRSARIEGVVGQASMALYIEVTEAGVWFYQGEAQPQLQGCIDIDLGFSPATNTLPIRRLALAVGQAEAMTAAWLKIPEFKLTPLPQTYTRTAAFDYLYQSANAGSHSPLKVNRWGLVTAYADYWSQSSEA